MKTAGFLYLLCITAIICPGRTAWADDLLSWEECVAEAREHHPDLVSAREKVNAAKADKDTARSSALPQLTSTASKDVSKSSGKAKTDSYAYGLSARQLLFDGFKTSNDIATARERISAASYNYQVASSNVRLRLRSAFVGLLQAQELLNVTKDILDRRQQNLGLVTLRYRGGREHKGSLMTAEASELQAEFEFEQAKRNLELYQRKLAKEMGRSSFAPVVASGELTIDEADPVKPAFEELVEATPLLKELAAQKEAAKYGLKSSRAALFPQVYADAGVGKNDSAWPPGQDSWSAGITISFPIFEGGHKQAAIKKAKAEYARLQSDERSGRDGVILTLVETWTAWQDGVMQAQVQEKFLEAARQRAQIVEAQYTTGLTTFNDWTTIEDDLVNAQKALLQYRTKALSAEASWLQAKGETLDE